MGFFGDMLKDLGSRAGEIGRIYRTERREAKTLTEEQRQAYNTLVQKAENGDVNAMVTLAFAFYNGDVLRYDPNEACAWWTKAAEAGDVESMYNLGLLYRGDLSGQFYNDELAVYWLSQASARGLNEAREALNESFKYSNLRQKWVRK